MRKMMMAALCASAMAASAHATVREEPVTYQDGETTMKGFVVFDDAIQGKRPGIIMVHEWWGITKHIHNEAQKFAQQGYTAFIADMYGDAKTADNPKDAGALSSSVMKDPKVMQARFNAARTQLAKHSSVDPARIGAVGYCFGGAVVLNMARSRRRPRRSRRFPRLARPQHPRAGARNRQGENLSPERCRRSLR